MVTAPWWIVSPAAMGAPASPSRAAGSPSLTMRSARRDSTKSRGTVRSAAARKNPNPPLKTGRKNPRRLARLALVGADVDVAGRHLRAQPIDQLGVHAPRVDVDEDRDPAHAAS